MKEEILIASQEVSATREEVFAFFSNPANLQRLTPPWVGFQILTPQPLPQGEGAIFEYRIKVHGLPLRWRTLIETWEPGKKFVDRQIQGPYALWHHTHTFEDLPMGGTRLRDRVRYRVGFGLFGRLLAGFIRRDVERIFAYRKQVIAGLFGTA